MRFGDSKRMTSAPRSARMRVHVGPAKTCARSMMRMPSSGSSCARSYHAPVAEDRQVALLVAQLARRARRRSRSPQRGRRRRRRAASRDIRNGGPASSARRLVSTFSKKPRSARCSSASRSAGVRHEGERQAQRLRRHHDLRGGVRREVRLHQRVELAPADHALALCSGRAAFLSSSASSSSSAIGETVSGVQRRREARRRRG